MSLGSSRAENPWAIPYQGTETRATARVIANIRVVDQIRGAFSGAPSGCDGTAGVVFDMDYLCDGV